MKKSIRLSIVIALLAAVAGCWSLSHWQRDEPTLAPFKTDGCSLFPDGTFKQKELWRECCIEHDIAYWQGGTKEDRMRADERLRDGIIEKTGNRELALLVYEAVRMGGAPVFPTWYRWGYGWNYGRGYEPLTDDERRQVEARLKEYRSAGK